MSGSPDPSTVADDDGEVGWGADTDREGGVTRPAVGVAVLWLVGTYGIAPRVIASAYRGESLDRLNRFFADRRDKPLGHFLQLWWDFAGALSIAGLVWLALAWWASRRIQDRSRLRLFRIHSGLFLLVTTIAGPRHDYVAFTEIWRDILNGSDPWAIHPVYGYATHAYGPAFNLLALPYALNPLLPKILFAAAFLLYLNTLPRGWLARLLTLFAWTEIAWFGHFDVLVGLCCVASARAIKTHEARAGGMLGLGVLLKIVPAALGPFVAMDGWRLRWRAALAITASVATGYAIAYMIWGPSVFRPFGFAAGRGSTFASIFRYLRGTASPLRLFQSEPNLDRWAGPSLVAAGLLLFAWTRASRIAPAAGMTLAALLTVLLYQVGFLQYQMVVMLMIVNLLVPRWESLPAALRVASLLHFGWLGVLNLWYASVGGVIHPGDPWAWADEWAGLPTFATGLFLFVRLAREARRPDWA